MFKRNSEKERNNYLNECLNRLWPGKYKDKFTRKQWRKYAKKDMPFCGMLETVQFKTLLLYDYISYDCYRHKFHITDESQNRQLKEMKEVLDLGWKIIESEDNEAYDSATKFLNENRTWLATIYNVTDEMKDFISNGIDVKESILEKLTPIAIIKGDKPYNGIEGNIIYFNYSDSKRVNNELNEKLKDLGIDSSKVYIKYDNAWLGMTETEGHDKYTELIKADNKAYEDDIVKYYELIGKYSDNWGD